jgi:two-component system chemotaxis response regulator CheB
LSFFDKMYGRVYQWHKLSGLYSCMEESKSPKCIIVIGASAGGINALCELVAQFQKEIDAAIFIVLHLSRRGVGDYLKHRLQQYTELTCHLATDELAIEKGNIYIAQPDFHLIVKKGVCKLTDGTQENRWRPSIDVLFRSAAAAYGEQVIGVMLTGLLDDGTSGMIAIKRSGGLCMVQDPNEAEYPEMPLSVLNNVEVDYSVPLAQMGFIISEHIRTAVWHNTPIPADVLAEAELAEKVVTSIAAVAEIGSHSLYACPDCGGGLWEKEDNGFKRYRCHIGHTYSQLDLMKKQQEQVESTLWIALRMMEERRNLLKRIADKERKNGLNILSADHQERAEELEQHIDILKKIIFRAKLV